MEATPPGQKEAAESVVVVALGGGFNLLRPRLLLGRTARTGSSRGTVAHSPSCLSEEFPSWGRRERAFLRSGRDPRMTRLHPGIAAALRVSVHGLTALTIGKVATRSPLPVIVRRRGD